MFLPWMIRDGANVRLPIKVSSEKFDEIIDLKLDTTSESRLGFYVEEEDFLVLLEFNKGQFTGRELTLFVGYKYDDILQLILVEANIDLFWELWCEDQQNVSS